MNHLKLYRTFERKIIFQNRYSQLTTSMLSFYEVTTSMLSFYEVTASMLSFYEVTTSILSFYEATTTMLSFYEVTTSILSFYEVTTISVLLLLRHIFSLFFSSKFSSFYGSYTLEPEVRSGHLVLIIVFIKNYEISLKIFDGKAKKIFLPV